MIRIITKKDEGRITVSICFDSRPIKKFSNKAAESLKAKKERFSNILNSYRFKLRVIWQILKANPRKISLQESEKESQLFFAWKNKTETKNLGNFIPGIAKILKKTDKKIIKGTAIVSIIALLLQISISLIPFTKANNLCPADADVVLVMDVSKTMADGGNQSRCEWCQQKPYDGSNTWFLNTKYDVTSDWCSTTRNQFDKSEVQFYYSSPTYTPAKNSKIEDATTTANSFLDNLKTTDQSALISFNSSQNLIKSLSDNHQATKDAVNTLTTSGYTNIGDALLAAKEELDAGRSATTTNKIIILLTDGRANKPNDGSGSDSNQDQQDINYAQLEIAQQIAGSGYKIYALGFGSDVNADLLQNLANTTGGKYYFEPTENDFNLIYQEISQIVCGSISGCKYQDTNNNGQIDQGEKKLAGWEIVLAGDANTTQLTDENGCYSFSGLLAGNYTVSEGENTSNQPYLQTFPQQDGYDITLAKGEVRESVDFANYLPGCGNQILDANFGEVCEIGDIQTCSAEAGYNGNQSCNNTCTGWGECVVQENCGDGIKNGNEECDGIEGLLEHYSCSQFCTLEYQPYCGDGARNQPTEECDGEAERPCLTANGYSGQQSCFDCLWSTCHAQEFCGDGIKNGQELCDDGNIQDGDGCSATCQTESQEPPEPVCGNDILEEGEQCDDGNTQNGDGCSSTCQTEEEQSQVSSGGGGSVPVFNLAISTKENKDIQFDTVTVTWFTNTPATSRVIYDAVSHSSLGESPNYGYAYSTTEDSNKVISHLVIIGGLTPGTTYFWRAISHGSPEIISDELSFTTKGVLGEEVSLEAIGEQLKEIEGKIEKIREELEKISPEVPEALAAEELTTEEGEIKGEVTEEVVKEPSTEVIKEEVVGLEKEEKAFQNKGLLAAMGAIPFSLKLILIIAGITIIGLFILWFNRKRKRWKEKE